MHITFILLLIYFSVIPLVYLFISFTDGYQGESTKKEDKVGMSIFWGLIIPLATVANILDVLSKYFYRLGERTKRHIRAKQALKSAEIDEGSIDL